MKNRKIFLIVGGQTIQFNFNDTLRQSSLNDTYCRVDVIDEVMLEKPCSHKRDDPLNRGW